MDLLCDGGPLTVTSDGLSPNGVWDYILYSNKPSFCSRMNDCSH